MPITPDQPSHHCPECQVVRREPGICPDCRASLLLSEEPLDLDLETDAESSLPVLDGRFRLGEFIARGRIGALYRGIDLETRQPVALKLLREDMAASEDGIPRFLAETALLQRLQPLNHEGIAILIADGCDAATGQHFMALRYEPDTLGTWTRPHTVSLRRALGWLIEIAAALQAAHSLGIIHGDLKPENILLDTSHHVRLADWGLAGTPGYMAPEMVDRGLPADARADIYALGVIMVQLLTGNRPYPQSPPVSSKQGVPRACDAIVRRALAVDPAQRYQSAAEMGADLRRVLGHHLHPPVHVRKWFRVTVAVVAGLAVISLTIVLLHWKNSRTRSDPAPSLAPTENAPIFPPAPLSSSNTAEFHPQKNPAAASATAPFQNTLGQWFAPLPGDASRLLCCTEARLRDFSAFAAAWPALVNQAPEDLRRSPASPLLRPGIHVETDNPDWWETDGDLTPDHPVSGITWLQARAFCWWLTRSEQAAGILPASARYRLPTAIEWVAAQLATANGNSIYPWGNDWPPPPNQGNFAGPEARKSHSLPSGWDFLAQADLFPRSAPVASYSANEHGFFDLSGNLQEWTADTLKVGRQLQAVICGTSWSNAIRSSFALDFTSFDVPSVRITNRGFRPLLDLGPPADKPCLNLTLHRISDLTGTPHSSEPGQPLATFSIGHPIRLTFRVDNTGGVATPAIVYANVRQHSSDAAGNYLTVYRCAVPDKPAAGGALPVSNEVPARTTDGSAGTAWFSFDIKTTTWLPGAHTVSASLRATPDGPPLDTTAPGPALPVFHSFWWLPDVINATPQ